MTQENKRTVLPIEDATKSNPGNILYIWVGVHAFLVLILIIIYLIFIRKDHKKMQSLSLIKDTEYEMNSLGIFYYFQLTKDVFSCYKTLKIFYVLNIFVVDSN